MQPHLPQEAGFSKEAGNIKDAVSDREKKMSFLEGLASDLCGLPSRIEVSKRASYLKEKFIPKKEEK